MELEARLATQVGTGAFLRIYAGGDAKCPGTPRGRRGCALTYHNAKTLIKTVSELEVSSFGGSPADYMSEFSNDPRWPDRCDGCNQPWDDLGGEDAITRQVFHDRIWDTASGELERGCLFWVTWDHWDEPVTGRIRDGKETKWAVPTTCPHGWANCDGRHLHAICPDGHEWDTNGRASNCGSPEDQEHRCWVREGEPPNVTVGKGGNTCVAGAGSIATPTWHGFLRAGKFVG